MKLVKTASGEKLQITKKEWLSLGTQCGWTRTAAMGQKIDARQAFNALGVHPTLKTFAFKGFRQYPKVGEDLFNFFSIVLKKYPNLPDLFSRLDAYPVDTPLADAWKTIDQKLKIAFQNASGNMTYKQFIWSFLLKMNELEETNTFNMQKIKNFIKDMNTIVIAAQEEGIDPTEEGADTSGTDTSGTDTSSTNVNPAATQAVDQAVNIPQ